MNKNWNGYFTVEASLVMPLVIMIYLLIILCGFYLYNRCVISQDNYLLAFRGSRFTDAGTDYGEVIYDEMEKNNNNNNQYILQRLEYKSRLYPFWNMDEQEIKTAGNKMIIASAGYKGTLVIKKDAEKLNILETVRKVRRDRVW